MAAPLKSDQLSTHLSDVHPEPSILPEGGSVVYIPVINSIAKICRCYKAPDFDLPHEQMSIMNYTQLCQSSLAQEKQDSTVTEHLFLNTMTDGFQASSSSKQHRLKPWMKTGTLVLEDQGQVWKTTFPIAIGQENDDKSAAEAAFHRDMMILDQRGGIPLYHSGYGKVVPVRVSLLGVKGDQDHCTVY